MSNFPLSRLLPLLAMLDLIALTASAQAQTGWTPARIEQFLIEARVLSTRPISQGVTNSLRATLHDGAVTHDAQIQSIDVVHRSFQTSAGYELDFRDSYKFNIAAYRLSRLLGLDAVPVSVERRFDGKRGAMTWWIDDVLMTEKLRHQRKIEPPNTTEWNQQIHRVRVFDQLIYNVDRNLGNLIITTNWKVWMIDHTRAFRTHKKLSKPEQLLRCDRALLAALRTLNLKETASSVRGYLTKPEVRALLARRDRILSHFEERIERLGEEQVLFDYGGPLARLRGVCR